MGSLGSLMLLQSVVQIGLEHQHAVHVSLSDAAPETSTCALKKPRYHNTTSLHENSCDLSACDMKYLYNLYAAKQQNVGIHVVRISLAEIAVSCH